MDRRHFAEDSGRRLKRKKGEFLRIFISVSKVLRDGYELMANVRFMVEQIVQGRIIDSKGNLNIYP